MRHLLSFSMLFSLVLLFARQESFSQTCATCPGNSVTGVKASAEVLQETIHASMIAWPEPPIGFRWVTANPFEIELIGNEYMQNGAYLTFYVENFTEADMCLDYTEMNFHYYGEENVIYQRVPQFHPNFPVFNSVEDWVFLNCDFEGVQDIVNYNTQRIRQINVLKYAQRYLVPLSEIPLPIELTDLN